MDINIGDFKSGIWRKSRPIKSFVYHKLYMGFLCWYLSTKDKKNIQSSGFSSLPPPTLRYRVGGRPELKVFLDVGKEISVDIDNALIGIGTNLDLFENVLDFGCGCGRTLVWFVNRSPKFFGTDIDPQAIAWCQQNLGFAKFAVNKSLPPLEYQDDMFDLIYAISVFTHLNEDYQGRWIDELKRVLKPKGILIATFHGSGSWNNLSPDQLHELKEKGFLFRITDDKKGVLPDWYQTAHHTKQYVLDNFGSRYKVLLYKEKGLKRFQDLAIFQKS